MSNLSDIGFPVQNEQDVNVLITETIKYVESIRCPQGFYLRFADPSGAEMYLQGNNDQELIGFNPHFAGKSRRRVGITAKIQRDSSELDGGFHAWADPTDETDIESGAYPFVFDVPDFRMAPVETLPAIYEIQLTAFASNDLQTYENEAAFAAARNPDAQNSTKYFISTGLQAFENAGDKIDLNLVRPIAMFAGEIKEFELKTNDLTGEKFYWLLIETLGGEADVVADLKLISAEPAVGGFITGQFWLSGKVIKGE